MKKQLTCLLLAFSLSLCGCDLVRVSDPSDTTTDKPQDTSPTYTGDEAYKNIVCREVSDFEKKTVAFRDSDYFFNFYVPYDWNLIKADDSAYQILCNGTEIGRLFSGEATDLGNWKTVSEKDLDYQGLTIAEAIEKNGTDSNATFRYRFTYSFTENNEKKCITMTVEYAEVGEDTEFELYGHVDFERISDYTQFSKLSNIKGGHFLLLGNAIHGTSAIGAILIEMVTSNQTNTHITYYWRGGATPETYINDEEIMNDIRNGKYNAVLIGGLYSSKEVENIGILKEACDISDTEIVIFPSHNESRTVIDAVCNKYNLRLLDWKEEIDKLIENGVKESDLCINNEYNQSTETAGYAGAHLVYRAIFGEVPTANLTNTIDWEIVSGILGDYVNTGNANAIAYYLK